MTVTSRYSVTADTKKQIKNMNNHRYILQKYTGIRSRTECPNCGKREFAQYIDTNTNTAINPVVGRCNREDNCGYHLTPAQWFDAHPNERKCNGGTNVTPRYTVTTVTAPKQICTIPKQYLIDSLGYDSNFFAFLCSLFDRYTLESPTIETIMRQYYLGQGKNKEVVFWQVDTEKRIRGGKLMQYDPLTGKRVKNVAIPVDWVHSRLKRANILSNEWQLTQCFFGEHLLNRYPTEPINIVESEKSAIIAFATLGGVWLATGGKQGLNSDKCRALKGRNVTLYPDLGAFNEWQEKGHKIAKEIGFTLRVSDLLEHITTDIDRMQGLDIADYLIAELQAATPIETIREPFTVEEMNLQTMVAKNPNIITLIEWLDLVSASTGRQLRIN